MGTGTKISSESSQPASKPVIQSFSHSVIQQASHEKSGVDATDYHTIYPSFWLSGSPTVQHIPLVHHFCHLKVMEFMFTSCSRLQQRNQDQIIYRQQAKQGLTISSMTSNFATRVPPRRFTILKINESKLSPFLLSLINIIVRQHLKKIGGYLTLAFD
jgi:hypothetical protein